MIKKLFERREQHQEKIQAPDGLRKDAKAEKQEENNEEEEPREEMPEDTVSSQDGEENEGEAVDGEAGPEEEIPGEILSDAVLEAAANAGSESSADPQEAIAALRTIAAATPEKPLGLDMYELIMRGLSYAADTAEAYRQGEVAGRNTRIDLLKLQAERQSDGVALLGGKPQNLRKHASIFDLARGAS